MMNRTLLAALMLLGAATATYAAEESSSRGDIPQSDGRVIPRRTTPPPAPPVARPQPPPQVYRPTPPAAQVYREPLPPQRREVYREPPRREVFREPPVIYYPAPAPPRVILRSAPNLGFTCQTRRFECELRRPRPLGTECECQTPSGSFRPGAVIP